MKYRNSIVATAILMLLTITTVFFQTDSGLTSAQTAGTQAKTQLPTSRPSSRIRSIVKGSEHSDRIPDMVAYELFLRTIAEGNASDLVRRAGFDGEELKQIMLIAHALNDSFLQPLDQAVFQLKTRSPRPSLENLAKELAPLQTKKDEAIARVVNRFLPSTLRDQGMNKLQHVIDSQVKRNIQKIYVSRLQRSTGLILVNSFSGSDSLNSSSGGSLYLYSAGWQEGMNVFGSGGLSEQYSSDTSYRVNVTITSPDGRSNSTESDWNYATLVSDSGLSVGFEDGAYSITSSFEEQAGYYDEYGNFVGTGGSYLGSSYASTTVAPAIFLGGATVLPSQFFLSGSPGTVGGQSGWVSATIGATQGVPSGTTVQLDLLETVNPRSVGYTVTAGQSTGHTPHPSGNRQIRRQVPTTGQLEPLSDLFRLSLSGSNDGSVTNQVRIDRIIASPPNSSGGVQGENTSTLATFVVSPTPTPTPPGNGGGGCDLFRTDGTAIKKGEQVDPARCSPCSPTVYELNECQTTAFGGGGGGTYDWEGCFCGQSPIMLDILGNGYNLTDLAKGIFFDIRGSGQRKQISWTAPTSDDAWLVLDRNQNNQIDDGTEMFGNNSEQPPGQDPKQGFATLGLFDAPARGGNADGKITRSDTVFRKLRLWVDRNHNGVSEPEEMFRLPALDVVALHLDYSESKRTDEHGNKFKYRAKVRDRLNARVGRWAWDVFLRTGN